MFIPLSTSSRIRSPVAVAGPRVQTIFVRLADAGAGETGTANGSETVAVISFSVLL